MLDLETVKNYLKVDYNDEDVLIQSFINIAQNYLFSLTNRVVEYSDIYFDLKMNGKTINIYSENEEKLAELYCLAFISELYNNRSLTIDKVKQNLRYVYQSVLSSLMYGGE